MARGARPVGRHADRHGCLLRARRRDRGQSLFRQRSYALPVRFGISVVFVGPAVAPVAVQGRYHQHADAIYPASWTAPYSYLTGDVVGALWELAGLAGLRGHAVRLMKRRGRHGLGGSCDGQNKSDSGEPDHCHLHLHRTCAVLPISIYSLPRVITGISLA